MSAPNPTGSAGPTLSLNVGKRPSILRLSPGLLLFTVLAAVSGVFIYSVVTNAAVREERTYRAEFVDVSGLRAGAEVQVGGVVVGQVEDLELTDAGTVQVSFSLDTDVPISDTSRALVRYKDLLGRRILQIQPGDEPGAPLEAGAMLPTDQTVAALDLDQLYSGFGPLFEGLDAGRINELSGSLVQVLQGQGGNLESILARTADLTDEVADRDAVIGRLVDNLDTVLTTIQARTPETNRLVVSLQQLVSGLSGDRQVLGRALQGIAGSTDEITRLIERVRPGLRADLRELRTLSTLLNSDADTLDAFLQRVPGYHALVGRVGIYQSAFQFYLCGVQLRFEAPSGQSVLTEMTRSQEQRCQS